MSRKNQRRPAAASGFLSAAYEKIQDVHAGGGLSAVQLGIAAAGAADGDEALVLNVEDLGEAAAGGLKLVGHIGGVAALGALVHLWLHRDGSFLSRGRTRRGGTFYYT